MSKSIYALLALALTWTSLASLQHPLEAEAGLLAEDGFHTYRSSHSSSHSLRIQQQNSTLCATDVTQYTGWLDVGSKHLFFWYFDAQAPQESSTPLTLWLTGGPGGSSMLGMLQELGPCLINSHGNGTVHNPFGWNKDTALIFVDQPAGVGFSYVDEGEPVPGTSYAAAEDMTVFLQMFINQLFEKKHKDAKVHISGESYGGHYLPTLGAQIVRQNLLYPRRPQIPLASVLIGNGYVSPLDTAFGYWETLCTTNPGVSRPVFNSTRCDIMAANMQRCIDGSKACYQSKIPEICMAAGGICWEGVIKWYDSESGAGGRNRFDITAPCEIDSFCYPNTNLIQKYLNTPAAWSAIDPPKAVKNYTVASRAVSRAFGIAGDQEINMLAEIEYLLAAQVDVLIYQGKLDLACNTAGAYRWTNNMPWKGQPQYVATSLAPWEAVVDGKKGKAGQYKETKIKMVEGSEKETRFALVTIDGSGHMVPQDQPEVALDMLTKWLAGAPWNGGIE